MSLLSRLFFLLVACALFVAGCASVPGPRAAAPAQAGRSTIQQDAPYMHQVESMARRRGIGVVWINPPVKRRPPPR
ncbi:MAG: hypothetical protein EPO46_06760 [Lysobacter sp.]|nr:MAG: hypothetical protein EPO46_06760 [Lysobacter sp.]